MLVIAADAAEFDFRPAPHPRHRAGGGIGERRRPLPPDLLYQAGGLRRGNAGALIMLTIIIRSPTSSADPTIRPAIAFGMCHRRGVPSKSRVELDEASVARRRARF